MGKKKKEERERRRRRRDDSWRWTNKILGSWYGV
jgi:hypothetical protein